MGPPSDAIPEDWSAKQRAIWQREKTYWELFSAGDIERFLDLWDERFIGWPADETTPITLSDLRTYEEDWIEEVSTSEFSYSLTPHAITVVGNVGITYYQAQMTGLPTRGEDDEEETTDLRMTHTWRKEETWKIIGGMSTPAVED